MELHFDLRKINSVERNTMEQETTEDASPGSPESPEPAVGPVGDDDDIPKRRRRRAAVASDSKPPGETARKRGRPKKKVAEATKPAAAIYEKPSVAVDALFFAGLNGTLKLMVQQERQHKLSQLAIV